MKKLLTLMLILLVSAGMVYSQSITVNSPNGGESWELGSTNNITWSASGLTNDVKITLWKGGVLVGLIAKDLSPSSGSYSWNVGTYTGGTAVCDPGYKIKIREQGGEDFTTEDDSNRSFNISKITVTDPNGGENWNKGESKNITWDAYGLVNDVKITLWNGGSFVGLIAKDISPSPGSYPWTVGNYDGGTAAVDTGYVIKVREQGGNDFTTEDSSNRTFEISSGVSLFVPGVLHLVRDFELKDIVYIFNRGGWIAARIKNTVSPFDGDLDFRVNFPDDPLPLGTTFNYTKRLVMRAGQERTVYLTPSSDIPGDISFCGKRVSITVDPDNKISETNERNNHLLRRIYTKTPDLQVTAPRSDLEIKKAYMKSSHRWRIIFKINVNARGAGYSSISNVRLGWFIKRAGADDSAQLYSHSFDPFSINHNEEKVFSINKTFGHPDKRRSIRPRLSEGRYSIVVIVNSSERLCERETRNNRYQFSINLQ